MVNHPTDCGSHYELLHVSLALYPPANPPADLGSTAASLAGMATAWLGLPPHCTAGTGLYHTVDNYPNRAWRVGLVVA